MEKRAQNPSKKDPKGSGTLLAGFEKMKKKKTDVRRFGVASDHVLASHTTFFNFQVHRSDFVHVTTRTSHDDGFIEIGAGFIVHGFSLFPARRFLIMDFRAGYSSTGEPQKITMYSPGRRRQFYNFIVSNEHF